MKKILVALDNLNLFESIKQIEGSCDSSNKVYENDLSYMEGVIEYLANNNIDKIITKDTLEGNMTKEIFVKQMRLVAPKANIVLFVKDLNEIYKNFLLSNGIYNIIKAEYVKEDVIKEILLKDKNIIYMENGVSSVEESRTREYMNSANTSNTKVITKKAISILGTTGAGKSYFTSVLGNIISKKLKLETLIVDLDIQNASIDIYNNLEGNSNILENIVNYIDNDCFDENSLGFMAQSNSKNSNLCYITNNNNGNIQNKIMNKHYQQIYKCSSKKYDVVIYDNNESMFFDSVYFSATNSDIIFFVINPNYICIRQAIKSLNVITNLWKIEKERINIVVNKSTPNSLTNEQIKSFLPEYKIFMSIPFDYRVENIINGLDNISSVSFKEENKIYELFGIDDDKKFKKNKLIRKLGE